jgi:hypothetical protein
VPPAELDFLNLPFPTVYVPIPDFTSLLRNINLPGLPGFPGMPEQPPTLTPTSDNGGTTVVDNTGTTDTTTNSTPDAATGTSVDAAATTPFFDTSAMPVDVAAVFDRVNDTLADVNRTVQDSLESVASPTVPTTPDVDIESPVNDAFRSLNRSVNNALSTVNDVLGGGFNAPSGFSSTA